MKLIIQIAGTSGSGKSHLMRSLLKLMRKDGVVEDQLAAGRIVGYRVEHPSISGALYIPGAYDIPTGGCDTIRDVKQVYEIVEEHHKQGCHVIYEGLFCMNQTRGPQLAQKLGKNYVVLQLTTPLATCLASINARRAERGDAELANKANTVDNYRRATNFCASMREAGAKVIRVSRDEGLDIMVDALAGFE